ncbi:hypothetical protein LV779_02540 [Streptomyces thinghirensis]|nr:hypothetical protein [Streptomyces thinghirensis]
MGRAGEEAVVVPPSAARSLEDLVEGSAGPPLPQRVGDQFDAGREERRTQLSLVGK